MKLQGLRGVNPSIYLGLTIANVASFHAIKFHSLLPRALSSPIIFLFYCYIRGTRGAAVSFQRRVSTSNRPGKHRGGGVSFAWEMEARKSGGRKAIKLWLFGKEVGIFTKLFKILEFSSDLFESRWGGVGWLLDRKSRTKRNCHENDFKSEFWVSINFKNITNSRNVTLYSFRYTRDTISRWKKEEIDGSG